MIVSPTSVERSGNFYHVRFRDSDEFDEIRTPDWARSPAESVAEGSEVRTGHSEASDEWEILSVLVPIDTALDEDHATTLAGEIVSKIES